MKTTKRRLSPRVLTLLRKARKSILSEPHLYNQNEPEIPSRDTPTTCETPGCICGWMLYHAKNNRADGVFDPSVALLGDETLVNRLYMVDEWPRVYLKAFHAALDDKTCAKIAAKRITHFIKTDGLH